MKTKVILLIVTASLIGGCSVGRSARGVVAMKISDTEAHACVRKIDVDVGDKMTLFRNECKQDVGSTKSRGQHCKLVRVGEGTISENLNEHYSVLKFDTPTEYREGDLLEKATR